MSGKDRYRWMQEELDTLAVDSLERVLHTVRPGQPEGGEAPEGVYLIRSGQPLLNLTSNNYLGLAGDRRIAEAMCEALLRFGPGAGASRFLAGNHPIYTRLEQALASWKERDAALVLANGYMANIGVVSALAGRGDAVFSDRLNHASIVDGIVLSRADHYRYRHNDMEHLHYLLERHPAARRKLIVTDAVFSMDGDTAPLQELVALKQKHNALLFVDEAHSGGVYGPEGAGLCRMLGLHKEIDILMGTFSKAFGLYGAYVCGDFTLIRYLLNKTRPLIYSTALPPSVLAGLERSLQIVREEQWRRDQLHANSKRFRAGLTACGFTIGAGDSAIVPLHIGDNETALRFSAELEMSGLASVAIRPPTVPAGTARIRFSIMATHPQPDLEEAVKRIRQAGLERGLISS